MTTLYARKFKKPRSDRPSTDARYTAKWTIAITLITTLITTGTPIALGWLQYSGPGSPEKVSVPARIITPVKGDKVYCPAVRGIIPPTEGDVAYWLAIQGADTSPGFNPNTNIYLIQRIEVEPARAPQWDAGYSGMAKDNQVNQDFNFLLLRTESDLTRDFADKIDQGKRFFKLAGTNVVVDQVRVTRTTGAPCPSGP
jgi:hypothetical protein